MLTNLRRKLGLATQHSHIPQPVNAPPTTNRDGPLAVPSNFVDSATTLPPMSMDEKGFTWSADSGIFGPSSIPLWLQEQVCSLQCCSTDELMDRIQSLSDLGLPINGSDGIFLNVNGSGRRNADFGMPEAW